MVAHSYHGDKQFPRTFHLEHISTLSECDQIKQLSQTPLGRNCRYGMETNCKAEKLMKNTESKLILNSIPFRHGEMLGP